MRASDIFLGEQLNCKGQILVRSHVRAVAPNFVRGCCPSHSGVRKIYDNSYPWTEWMFSLCYMDVTRGSSDLHAEGL